MSSNLFPPSHNHVALMSGPVSEALSDFNKMQSLPRHKISSTKPKTTAYDKNFDKYSWMKDTLKIVSGTYLQHANWQDPRTMLHHNYVEHVFLQRPASLDCTGPASESFSQSVSVPNLMEPVSEGDILEETAFFSLLRHPLLLSWMSF